MAVKKAKKKLDCPEGAIEELGVGEMKDTLRRRKPNPPERAALRSV
jgi:hypothetical protein